MVTDRAKVQESFHYNASLKFQIVTEIVTAASPKYVNFIYE